MDKVSKKVLRDRPKSARIKLPHKIQVKEGQFLNEQYNTRNTSLQKSSERWHENDNNYFHFIENFLFTLKMSYFELDSRFSNLKDKKITKKQRIEAFITDSLLPVSKREICDKLPDISVTTIETELSKLLKAGKIEKLRSGRATKYKASR